MNEANFKPLLGNILAPVKLNCSFPKLCRFKAYAGFFFFNVTATFASMYLNRYPDPVDGAKIRFWRPVVSAQQREEEAQVERAQTLIIKCFTAPISSVSPSISSLKERVNILLPLAEIVQSSCRFGRRVCFVSRHCWSNVLSFTRRRNGQTPHASHKCTDVLNACVSFEHVKRSFHKAQMTTETASPRLFQPLSL